MGSPFSKDTSMFSNVWETDRLPIVLTEPQLNSLLFILDVLSDRMCLLNNSEWSHFCTRRSAGSSALEPAGDTHQQDALDAERW